MHVEKFFNVSEILSDISTVIIQLFEYLKKHTTTCIMILGVLDSFSGITEKFISIVNVLNI